MVKQRLLIAADDQQIIRQLYEVLSSVGYEVISSMVGKTNAAIVLEQPDLVIIDSAADHDQDTLTRQVRDLSEVPIIILSPSGLESDILAGFEAGADDYLVKPIRFKELIVRISAILRRCIPNNTMPVQTKIQCGDLSIDLQSRKVKIGANEIYLTAKEFTLLSQLAQDANQIYLHEQLLTKVWGPEYRNDVDYLRSYVHNLRKKLERNPSQPELIITIQGVGYMLVNRNLDKKEKV